MREADASVRGWERLAAFALSVVFLLCGVAAVLFAFKGTLTPDFVSYWAAGHLAASGDAGGAYDIARHHAVEAGAAQDRGLLPFAYPPSFLLFLLPFGLLSFPIAFAAWTAATALLYLTAARRLIDVRLALAQAAAAANFVIGQNGFLTAGLFVWGTDLLASRPFLAGAILGLLSIKPQLAILVPIALLAGREWRALAGAVSTAAVLLALSFLIFGPSAFSGFVAMVGQSAGWLGNSRWHWGQLASPFALFRLLGIAQGPALAAQAVIALAATGLTVRAWWGKSDGRVPILAAASLLISPYLFTYDGLFLTVPLAWAFCHGQRGAALAIWVLSLSPLAGYVSDFPNTIPLAAMIALWALHRRRPHQV